MTVLSRVMEAAALGAVIVGGPIALRTIAAQLPPITTGHAAAWIEQPLHTPFMGWSAIAVGWLVWAMCTAAICAHGIRRLRHHRPWQALHLRLPGPVQSLHAAVLGAAAVSATTSHTPAHATPVSATDADRPLHTDGQPAPCNTGSSAIVERTTPAVHNSDPKRVQEPPQRATGQAARAVRPVHQAASHHVVRGDTLWDIAGQRLGDPDRWHDIYHLNQGHEQPNGYALTDPDDLHTGWILALPTPDSHPSPKHTAAPAIPSPTDPAPPAAPDDPALEMPTRAPHTASPPAEPEKGAPRPTADSGHPSRAASPTRDSASTPPADTTAPHSDSAAGHDTGDARINLPSQGWISLGLAALLATVASLLRLQRRRHAPLRSPISTRITAQPTPVPASLAPLHAPGARHLPTNDDEPHRPTAPAVPAPIGIDPDGGEVSLFDLPGPGLALTGEGAASTARAVLAAALATGATQSAKTRPVVVTTTEILAWLLPAGAPLVGLDPDGTSYDGERLIVLNGAAAAITHAEEEMIVRRRLLDTFDLDTVATLNERTDHAEMQPPYVLLIEATPRHVARLLAVGAHRPALHLHPVILGPLDDIPAVEIAADGTTRDGKAAGLARLSTLAADDLAAVLAMLTDAAPRQETGHDIDLDPAPSETPTEQAELVPAQPREAAPVRLRVLGPVSVETETGPVATGMRSGSYTVLASLVVHPCGRTLDQLAVDLHPDTEPGTAGKRIRTDISTTRRVLRAATGNPEAMFVVYDPATGRYRLDAELIAVDLWQMLTAIEAANNADNDTQALALLREAVELYGGDFADGADQTWITDYATTYRHQILAVLARIAEILEPDHPDQAVAALERALELDPVNEELYQRVMRIHGRAGRPDAVRRTLRRLEDRLADLGDAEPSQATRRVADRQLRPAAGGPR